MNTTVIVRKKGQVVIPEPIRIALKIKEGDLLNLKIEKVKNMNSIMDDKKDPKTFAECNTGTCHDCILYFHNLKAVNCERRLYLIQKEELIWSDDGGWQSHDRAARCV